MFDINGGEFLVLLVVAVIVIGPERLPKYAEQLARLVRNGRTMLKNARERVDAELGEQGADIDWAALDPRKYDPRRIVRDALLDDTKPVSSAARVGGGAVDGVGTDGLGETAGSAAVSVPTPRLESGAPAPFDDEAT